ncbi:TraM recognition domain-containing protein [Spiroplasma endosymbiont of Cleonymus obscurus]|uniref:TraM recognition domain-containing protein n=1 Tax=Spiroplasma endosymbiont of Cleonymus obscurus TaxID=3066324 RepID=UPI0037DC36E1
MPFQYLAYVPCVKAVNLDFKLSNFKIFADDLSTDKKKLLNTIFGNVGNIIAHKVSDVESPEYIAKVFGTRTVEKITKQYDTKNKKSSKGSIREVEEYIVHPNDLKRLKTGQAYCKILLTNANQFIKKIDIKNYEREK